MKKVIKKKKELSRKEIINIFKRHSENLKKQEKDLEKKK